MGNRNRINHSNQTIAMCKLSPFFLLLLLLLSGCAANKSNIDYLQKDSSCPVQFSFNGSYKQVWQATLRALAEEEIIKTINQDAGIVVTEYETVDNLELNAIDTAFGARTYKYSYSINLMKAKSVRTNVSVKTNLMTSQLALYEREENISWLESYLRKKLFIRICKQLNPGEDKECNSFTKKNNLRPPPPVVSSKHKQERKPDILVLQVQTTLNKRGYNPGQVDGFMGRKTRGAIRQFQKDTNIAVTGHTDQNTLVALGLKEGAVKYNDHEFEEKSSPQDQHDTKTIQLASTTSLLQTKDPFSQKIATIPQGSVIAIKSIEGEWYQVQYQNQIGFIHWAFVVGQRKSPPDKASANNTAAQDWKNSDSDKKKKEQQKKSAVKKNSTLNIEFGKGKVVETTSLLSGPSFMTDTIHSVAAGQQIELLQKKGKFYKVRHKGKEGYIYIDFVEVTESLQLSGNKT